MYLCLCSGYISLLRGRGTRAFPHHQQHLLLFPFLSSEPVQPGATSSTPLPPSQAAARGEPHASPGVQDPGMILVRACGIACVVCINKLVGAQGVEEDFGGEKPSDSSTA